MKGHLFFVLILSVSITLLVGSVGARPSLLVADGPARLRTLNGGIFFIDSGQNLGSSWAVDVAFGDLDDDGDLDVFVANAYGVGEPNKVYFNNGVGSFTDSGQSLGNASTHGIILGDLDGDGDLDAFTANGYVTTRNKVWLNNGAGGFVDSGQDLGFSRSANVALGDLDNDGDLDALVVNFFDGNRVWLNDGFAVFSDSGQTLGNLPSGDVALGDLDGDGDLDAFITNASDAPANKVWLNDGIGNFTNSGQSLGDSHSSSVFLGDLDGDGDLDAFIANSVALLNNTSGSPTNKVWLNDGTGSFTDSGQSLGNQWSKDVVLADLDGDGDLDAFVANGGVNKVWLNGGTGNFTDSGLLLGSSDSYTAALGDLDGDGDLDVYVGNGDVEPDKVWINTDCSVATAKQPIVLVTGWSGSVDKGLRADSQLSYFVSHLAPLGYVEGCNLFYATATSPYSTLDENAWVIRNNICLAYYAAKAAIPGWNGHFDIIAHSYGGLRARAYLENDNLYGQCPGNYRVYVDNLFTMGTPHGGEIGDLPFATIIGASAMFGLEMPALREMFPPVRLWQNLGSEQAPDICYYLLAGDARQQPTILLTPLAPFYLWPTVVPFANDFAVHEYSAHALALWPLSSLYPDAVTDSTDDLHGQVPWYLDPFSLLRSYVNPNSTFESYIWPNIGKQGCQSLTTGQNSNSNQYAGANSVMELIAQQSQPQQVTAASLIDIQAGSLASDDVLTGQFEMNGSGESQIMLYWSGGDVGLALTDPLGSPVNSQVTGSDSNIGYLSLDTGFGLMASYQITNTITGTWAYTITANALNETAVYRLLAIPSTPIAISGSVPAWLPNNSPVVITAIVSYSATTPVVGGSVTAQIRQPDDTTDVITLFDDGNNQDGAANDGVFGTTYSQTNQGGFYGILFTATGSYNSETYTRTATAILTIAPDNASLSGQYNDDGIDENGDNLYEWLELSAEIVVTEPSTYTLSAELYAGDTFITHANEKLWLETGTQTIALRFSGEDVNGKQLDGPYTIRNVMLVDESQVTLMIEADDNVHTTAAYSYQQFGIGNKVYLPIVIRN